MQTIRIATRGSELAQWQARHIGSLLRTVRTGSFGRGPLDSRAADPTSVEGIPFDDSIEIELVVVSTTGDENQDVPIWEIGGKGVFVKEVQRAVLDGRADLAVHSAKDLPSSMHAGLVIAGVPERGDPRDALVGKRLADLAPGACVATGSVRRRAQLASLRPDLTFVGLRGNIATRLAVLDRHPDSESLDDQVDAVLVAAAAMTRLGIVGREIEVLEPDLMVPQVGQGSLAVECRDTDQRMIEMLGVIDHAETRRVLEAERSFLETLGGDCDLPAGAHAVVAPSGDLSITGILASIDGRVVLREVAEGADTIAVGRALAEKLLKAGGTELLTQ